LKSSRKQIVTDNLRYLTGTECKNPVTSGRLDFRQKHGYKYWTVRCINEKHLLWNYSCHFNVFNNQSQTLRNSCALDCKLSLNKTTNSLQKYPACIRYLSSMWLEPDSESGRLLGIPEPERWYVPTNTFACCLRFLSCIFACFMLRLMSLYVCPIRFALIRWIIAF